MSLTLVALLFALGAGAPGSHANSINSTTVDARMKLLDQVKNMFLESDAKFGDVTRMMKELYNNPELGEYFSSTLQRVPSEKDWYFANVVQNAKRSSKMIGDSAAKVGETQRVMEELREKPSTKLRKEPIANVPMKPRKTGIPKVLKESNIERDLNMIKQPSLENEVYVDELQHFLEDFKKKRKNKSKPSKTDVDMLNNVAKKSKTKHDLNTLEEPWFDNDNVDELHNIWESFKELTGMDSTKDEPMKPKQLEFPKVAKKSQSKYGPHIKKELRLHDIDNDMDKLRKIMKNFKASDPESTKKSRPVGKKSKFKHDSNMKKIPLLDDAGFDKFRDIMNPKLDFGLGSTKNGKLKHLKSRRGNRPVAVTDPSEDEDEFEEIQKIMKDFKKDPMFKNMGLDSTNDILKNSNFGHDSNGPWLGDDNELAELQRKMKDMKDNLGKIPPMNTEPLLNDDEYRNILKDIKENPTFKKNEAIINDFKIVPQMADWYFASVVINSDPNLPNVPDRLNKLDEFYIKSEKYVQAVKDAIKFESSAVKAIQSGSPLPENPLRKKKSKVQNTKIR